MALLLCAFAIMPIHLGAATNDLSGLLQKGLFEEEANRNLDAAVQAYQAVSAQFDRDRKLAATAIFRLGEVYRKQGKTNEAVAQYERIVREFADQDTLANLSRQNLAGIGTHTPPTTATAPPLTRAARLAQKQLLEAEINLVEQDLAEIRKQVDVGRATQSDLRAREREVLKLRQQVVALDAEESSVGTVTRSLPAPDAEEAEIRRLQAMLQNSPDLINAPSGEPSLTPLCRAAGNGQLRVAAFLLDHGADINLNSPLRSAASGGHKAMVELLLGRGADANAADNIGQTPLHKAADKGFLSVTEALLTAKADPNVRDISSQTPLTLAAKNGFLPVAAALLASGADPNVASRADPNVASKVLPGPGYGMYSVSVGRSMFGTPLHFAAARGDATLAALLLTNRADVNMRSIYDETPLDVAAALGRIQVAGLLLAAGADPNAVASSQAGTPLHLAAGAGHREMVKLLLEHGANPNATALVGTRGTTPLMQAASQGDNEMTALLLEHKADPNVKNELGGTALWLAIGQRKLAVVRTLLARGADPNRTDAYAVPPLIRAVADQKDKDLTAALLEAKADVNAVWDGKTALHFAAELGNLELLKLLLAAGADPNARDPSGRTPLDIAKAQKGDGPALAALLRQHGALDELPDFNTLRITRGTLTPFQVFQKDERGLNRFTLFEVLLNFYGQSSDPLEENLANPGQMSFPDLTRIRIVRSSPAKPAERKEITVNVLNATNGIDCAKDVPLEFSDVIEIPEREHTLAEPAVGLTDDQKQQMAACVEKTVRFVVRDNAVEVKVAGAWAYLSSVLRFNEVQRTLRSSSDLSRLTVRRTDPKTGKTEEMVIDARPKPPPPATGSPTRQPSQPAADFSTRLQAMIRAASGGNIINADDLWLRDGDLIEVPDKP